MQNNIGKLLEKIVYKGFYAGVETWAVTLDLEDAYSKVSFEKLIHFLLNIRMSPILINWIAATLFKRQIVFKCER